MLCDRNVGLMVGVILSGLSVAANASAAETSTRRPWAIAQATPEQSAPEPAPPARSQPDAPSTAPPASRQPEPAAPPQPAQFQPPAAQAPSPFTAPLTAANSPQSLAPNMIGDLFGSGGSTLTLPAFTPTVINAAGNPFTPNTPIGDNVAFTLNSNGVLNLTTTLVSVPTVAALNAQPSVDAPGFAFELVDPNNAIARDIAATTGNPAAVTSLTAQLVANDTINPGISPFDAFNLSANALIADPTNSVSIVIPDPGSPGLIVGRQKVSENSSPLPRTRVYVNYSYFDNVPLAPGGVGVNRVTPGFEYAFLDDMMSVELRAPFAGTLNPDVVVGGATDEEVQFGDLTLYFKALLYQSQTFAFSAGLGVTVPTADDLSFALLGGAPLIEVENETVHLLPYLGLLYTPNRRAFMQGFVQLDIDANGNPVLINTDGTGLRQVGRVQDEEVLFVDLGVGYWMYQNLDAAGLRGLAPTFEIHYSQGLEDEDVITAGAFQVGDQQGRLSLVNAVVGLTALVGDAGTATIGYATPLAGDEQFDGELRLMFNWFFGGNNSISPIR